MDLSEYSPGDNIAGTQYRVVKLLGFGGHGSVYAVEHAFLQAPGVMKLLHSELALETDLAHRMTREARTLAKLRHPNIVEVRDGGLTSEDPPRPYFVMESLNGMSLRDLVKHMRGRGIGVLPALRIIGGVFEGLHHAHSAGVIHRDIKPDNIFLHRTSTDITVPKILDFGIAHLLLGKRFTGKSFVGTPRYAAPEQLLGDEITVATDIYSAGLVLYELMTGRAPYADRKNLGPLLHAHLHEKLPRVSSLAPDSSPEVDRLVEYLLEKDPKRRPPTAFAAAVALRELRSYIEEHEPTALEEAGFATQPTPVNNFLVERTAGGIHLVTEDPRPAASSVPNTPPTPRVPIPTLLSEGTASVPPQTPPMSPSQPPQSTAPFAQRASNAMMPAAWAGIPASRSLKATPVMMPYGSTPPRPSTPPKAFPSAPPARSFPSPFPARPQVDRSADTRTSNELMIPRKRSPLHDTTPFSLESPVVPELVPSVPIPEPEISYAPPSQAAIDSTTATDFGEASGVGSQPRPRTLSHRLAAHPVLVFAIALILFSGFGVPIAVTIARRYAPPVPNTPSSTTALSATISTTSSDLPPASASASASARDVVPPPEPVTSPSASVSASSSVRAPRVPSSAPRLRSKPPTSSSGASTPPPPEKCNPGDPRCVGYD